MSTPVLGLGIATAYGYDLTEDDGTSVGLGVAYAGGGGFVAVSAGTLNNVHTGGQLRVSIYAPDNETLIAHLPRRSGVQGQIEQNAAGSGSLTLWPYDDVFSEHPDLWDDDNVVRVYLDAEPIHAWVMRGWTLQVDEDGNPMWAREGPGLLAVLGNAALYPETTLRKDTSDDRFYNFGSVKDADWYVASEWVRPKAVSWRRSHRHPLPRGWRFKKAYWLWRTNPERATRATPSYFRGSLTLSQTTRVRFWAVGDESLVLLLDGEVLLKHGYGAWKKPKPVTRVLPAGTHVIAAKVTDNPSTDDRRMGFLFAAAKVDKKGKVLRTLKVSSPSSFRVRGPGSAPPGWFPAAVLKDFVEEAQARGVVGFDGLTVGFTAKKDTSGRPWTRRLAQSYRIGTKGTDLVTQLVERGLDVAVTPLGVLQAWVKRGVDRSSFVTLAGGVVTSNSGTGSTNDVINQALVKYRGGWTEYADAGSKGTYGRRETGLSAGGAMERADARSQAAAAFREFSDPEVSYEVTTSSLRGPQPVHDYNIGDLVMAPSRTGGWTRARVLSLTFSEDDTGAVSWTQQVRPE